MRSQDGSPHCHSPAEMLGRALHTSASPALTWRQDGIHLGGVVAGGTLHGWGLGNTQERLPVTRHPHTCATHSSHLPSPCLVVPEGWLLSTVKDLLRVSSHVSRCPHGRVSLTRCLCCGSAVACSLARGPDLPFLSCYLCPFVHKLHTHVL